MSFDPVLFDPPQLPLPPSIFDVVEWVQTGGPLRFLDTGVEIRPLNFGGEVQVAEWEVPWNATEAEVGSDTKIAERPDIPELTAFVGTTVYAFDRDPCPGRIAESERKAVRDRAQYLLELHGTPLIEAAFETRAVADAGTAITAGTVIDLISKAEVEFGAVRVAKGTIFSPLRMATHMAAAQILRPIDGGWVSPMGHRVVFLEGITDTILTTQIYGWRGELKVMDAIDHFTNDYIAVAERSVLLGYEKAVKVIEHT